MEIRWLELARAGRKGLAQREQSEPRQLQLDAVARQLNLTKGTLSNYLEAEEALGKLIERDPGLEKQLRNMPASSVITLERWARHDWEGMAAFLHSEDRPSYRRVLAGEQRARLAQGRGPRSHLTALIETMSSWNPRQVVAAADRVAPALQAATASMGLGAVRFMDLDWTAAPGPYEAALGLTHLGRLDLDLEDRDQRDWFFHGQVPDHACQDGILVAGVIEVGPQALAENYRKTARLLWTRAVASSTVVPVVVVLFPDADARTQSVASFPQVPQRLSALGSSARQGWFRPLDARGAVALLTTPDSLLADWGQAIDPA